MFRKILKKIKLFWYGLFIGMKATEDEVFHQSGLSLEASSSIHQDVADKNIAKALLKGEITQDVIDLRYRTYAVSRESGHYSFFSPTLTMKKGVNDYKYAKDSISLDDEREIITIQDNKLEVETVTDSLFRIGDNGKFVDKQNEYNIKFLRGKLTTPRFKLEDFVKKVVVKRGDDEWTAVLDLYVSKYPDNQNKSSKPFVRELERIIDTGVRSDMFDIKSISFDTFKAYLLDDMLHFEFCDIKLERIFEYDGSYVIRLFTSIKDGGSDKTEQFYSEQMAEKYKNKEKKDVVITLDFNTPIRTYKCSCCGKEVTYDARALDSMNATDDFSDGKLTEYLDFEMTEHEFGKMLCRECAQKEQEKLYKQIISNNSK